jgi:hypothetical protein
MKKVLISLSFVLLSAVAGAQQFHQDVVNAEMLHPSEHRANVRREIFIPQVNGFNVYKADLHTHSVYSDGQVLPKFRVQEAWLDGIDIMAVTEHVEYRPVEADMALYLEQYIDKKHEKEIDKFKKGKRPDKDGKMVDMNTSVNKARAAAKGYGITIIPGVEISRNAVKEGHFNALFTTDNNLVYDKDAYKSIKNAKAQGALIQHNHPGWRRTEIGYNEFQKKIYGEGLVDGVEVVNSAEIYPGITDRCNNDGLYITANSDIHASTASTYRVQGEDRPMTLVFAKDKSLGSVREALDARRTLAYAYGNVWGADQLLKDMFLACVKYEKVSGRKYQFTNVSSVPFVVAQPGKNPVHIDPMTSVFFSVEKDSTVITLEVRNMWNGAETHPTVEISVK